MSEASSEPSRLLPPQCWLTGGGEMGDLIRSFDWSQTDIGPIEGWSPTLKTIVKFLIANRFPLLLWWGPNYISIYNDAYRPVLGEKHSWALGKPVRECWSEIWHVLQPLIDTPFNGGPATWNEDIELEIDRYGFREETHFTVAYSPVPDDEAPSGIGGVLATVTEITDKVVGERRMTILRDIASQAVDARTLQEACEVAAKILGRHEKDVPFAIFYLVERDRNEAKLAGAAGLTPDDLICPKSVSIDAPNMDAGWCFPNSAGVTVVNDLAARFGATRFGDGVETTPLPADAAVILTIASVNPQELDACVILGVSPRLKLDERYLDFIKLLGTLFLTLKRTKCSANVRMRWRNWIARRPFSSRTSATNFAHRSL
jgi:hypothetical protein